MSELILVLLLAGLVFAVRIGGLFSGNVAIPDIWERALRFAPVAVLSALTASLLVGQASGDPLRFVAAAGAAAVMLRVRRMWLCILSGFVLYWALRLLIG